MAHTDWDDEFSNAKYIPQGMSYPQRWKDAATSFIENHARVELDIAYGSHPRQVFDLFWPSSQPRGLVVFVHGGYWIDFDKSYWSHLAKGSSDQGWAVAIPSYVLAPEARISEITHMMVQMIEKCAQVVAGPIVLVGHSAGGHLVTRMACKNTVISIEIRERIQRFVSISGVHDLRNLLHTQMNKRLRLTAEEAISESPSLHEPVETASVLTWVGSKERPEFLRQSEVLYHEWRSRIKEARNVVENDRHHFDIIDLLTNSRSSLSSVMLGVH
ncbi:MAG: alpha/beta hydrolase [Gammaproteobacteria bacterium]|nr:alpha/beta hydrolase [Gammaproteobacteria bacterium]